MDHWKPKMSATFDAGHVLAADERFVLSCLDGCASLTDLSTKLGVPVERIAAVVLRLVDAGAVDARPYEPREAPPPAADARVDAVHDAPTDTPDVGEVASLDGEDESADAVDDESAEDADGAQARDVRNYRMLYETELHPLERDVRIAAAKTEAGPRLLALCFDADPQVVGAVLENPTSGLDHARLIAFHHKNPSGLEKVVARPELLRDGQVQRRLLRNDQLAEAQLKRLLAGKRMMVVYKLALDREVPERSRAHARGNLRQKFASAASEERVELVLQSEGRALTLLVGQTLDARTTSLLCARTHSSIALIQNLARFPACPPPLLAHLVKQPLVKRQPQLRKLLLQHPNMPGEIKRQLS